VGQQKTPKGGFQNGNRGVYQSLHYAKFQDFSERVVYLSVGGLVGKTSPGFIEKVSPNTGRRKILAFREPRQTDKVRVA